MSSPSIMGARRTQLVIRTTSHLKTISEAERLLSPSSPITPISGPINDSQHHRGKLLTQALRKSKEMQGFHKSVDLALIRCLPSSSTATPSIAGGDSEDEDWAVFINSGYGDFPSPPEHTPSPSTANDTVVSCRSDRSFISPSTSATSCASSRQSKTGIDWLDEDVKWHDSDGEEALQSEILPLHRHALEEDREEEAEEIVHSPNDRASATLNRQNQTTDATRAEESRPCWRRSPPLANKRYSRYSVVNIQPASRFSMDTEHDPVSEVSDSYNDVAEEASFLSEARRSRSSISSKTSSVASSGTFGGSCSSHPYSASTRASSASMISDGSMKDSLVVLQAKVSRSPRMSMTGSQVKDELSGGKRHFLGARLNNEAHHSALPGVEVVQDDQSYVKREDRGSFNVESVPCSTSPVFAALDTDLPSKPIDRSKHTSTHRTREQETAGKLRDRLMAKISKVTILRRSSTPDVPVTPDSADGSSTVYLDRPSPNTANFGSAAINVRASEAHESFTTEDESRHLSFSSKSSPFRLWR
ncbi:hypothetical protein CBS101457_004873 [Exobasidium rhododendri]|nr:hypothetical protein CBS101457_004873 [Exobasidium rhododendri]